MKKILALMLLTLLLAACTPAASPSAKATTVAAGAPTAGTLKPTPTATPKPTARPDAFAFEQNRRLGRGVNFGNALEAAKEGQWGVTLRAEYFKAIKDGGFDSIRVPIKWSAHANVREPYTIDPVFFERIDWVVKNAQDNGLAVILDLHHYDEMAEKYAQHKARFLAIWDQIARHYQDAPGSVYFELMNEPNGSISSTNAWNGIVADVIPVIRKTNPQRTIIVGPGDWYSVSRLDQLRLPESDRNIIVSFHYYAPFQFTHQCAEWAEGSDAWKGTTWEGSFTEKEAIASDFDQVRHWSEKNNRPIFLGEFGAYSKADMPSRARWTEFIARSAEERGFSWSYWEFCAGFGVYDSALKTWVDPLYKALIPD